MATVVECPSIIAHGDSPSSSRPEARVAAGSAQRSRNAQPEECRTTRCPILALRMPTRIRAVSAIAGGTASVLSGGKFANGAITGAFAQLYNVEGGALVGSAIGIVHQRQKASSIMVVAARTLFHRGLKCLLAN